MSVTNQYSGAGVYALNLIREFNSHDDFNFIIFCGTKIKQALEKLNLKTNFELYYCPFKNNFGRILFEQMKIPELLKKKENLLLHSFSNILPVFFPGIPYILTLHDVMFKIYPERYGSLKSLYYNYFVSRSIILARLIIAPTISSKNDIMKFFSVASEKIKVIPYSGNEFLTKEIPVEIEEKIKRKYIGSKKFFLFTGSREPGKNIDFLYELMKYFPEYHLFIAGGKGWKTSYENQNNITLVENLTNCELSVFYKYSLIFLYPSIYEGVGLPVFEAKYFGKPIICSDYPAAHEIISKDRLFPLEKNLWIDEIKRIIETN